MFMKFLAIAIFHAWVHFIGFYSYSTREQICRAAFLRARNAFAAEERAVQENTRLKIIWNFFKH
ncbi:unnamed protein product [Wuchereria bancrofti]|uniref:Uncharacterized protein n=1 Tax=Wuchereria bancrofti TaxID=6293 RepID=A0A3P7GL40_WUCBA|nr:unnamed protein product [Wuchereria bancrofti]